MATRKDQSNEYRRRADSARRLSGKASDGASRQILLNKAEECEEKAAAVVETSDGAKPVQDGP
jgi:hypothetical protein